MTRPNQGLSSLAPGGGKMSDPGNEVSECRALLVIFFILFQSKSKTTKHDFGIPFLGGYIIFFLLLTLFIHLHLSLL